MSNVTKSFDGFGGILNNNSNIDIGQRVDSGIVTSVGQSPIYLGTVKPAANEGSGVVTETGAGVTGTGVVSETGAGVTGTGGVTEVDAGGDASALPPATAQAITSMPYIGGDKKTYEVWMTEGGYDPDGDYQNAKNQLEYDYMTSMANYGQQAEQLYQMGLSGSGVSDIFQVGAYNSYMKSQNDLANALIERKKEIRREYNAYSETYDQNLKADQANAYNFGLGIYNGENIKDVRSQLTTQGFHSSVVDNAIENLGSLNSESLPVVKAQNEAHKQQVEALYNEYKGSYSPSRRDALQKDMEARGMGDCAEEVLDRLDSLYNSLPENERPDYVDVEGVASTIKLTLASDDYGNIVYSGSNSDKQLVKDILNSQGMSDKADDIIREMDRDFVGQSLDKIESYSQGGGDAISAAEIVQAYNLRVEEEGTRIQNATKKYIVHALNNNQAFQNAYTFVGVDKATWDGYDDATKLMSVLNTTGELYQKGVLNKEQSGAIFEEWVINEFEQIERGNILKAKTSINMIGVQLFDFIKKGYIDQQLADTFSRVISAAQQALQNGETLPTYDALKLDAINNLTFEELLSNREQETSSKAAAPTAEEVIPDRVNKLAHIGDD